LGRVGRLAVQPQGSAVQGVFQRWPGPSDHATLAIIAESVGLDIKRAAEILASDEYAAEVREQEQLWVSRGVSSVPTIVFNDQYAVSGGQPVETFVGAIRQIIRESRS
jgi:predicted DsbA family dithiol-disulfide isomerase